MRNIKIKFSLFLFTVFITINFLIFSGLFDTDSPVASVKRYYSALQTIQDQLAFRQLEEFDWKSMPSISRESIYRHYVNFAKLREKQGLIKNFQIIDDLISQHSAEIKVKIRWNNGNEGIDKVRLSNRTGNWKIVSAEIYY